MGGCVSQKRKDSEAMSADIDVSTVGDPSASHVLVHNGSGQVPVHGGSSEYVGAFMRNDMTQKNAVEQTGTVSNNQAEQPIPNVSSSNVYKNPSELIVDVPVHNAVKTSVDRPGSQILEEQPNEQQIIPDKNKKEEPANLLVRHNLIQKTLPPVTSSVQHDYRNVNEPVFNIPIASTVNTYVDQPLYHPFEECPMVERTLHNPIMEEQPVFEQAVRNQIYEKQSAHPISSGDPAVLLAQPSETLASVDVQENVQIAETQQPAHDLGVVFDGRMYQTRVFDPNLNEYVYVMRDDLQPRGGLVM